MRETGFTDRQLEQLGKILEVALAPIKQDIAELKQDMIEVKQDIAEIKALPTIARELSKNKKNK